MKPYYTDSHVTIYHGDCRELSVLIPAECVVLTDPPYGTGQKIAYDVYRDTMHEWLALMQFKLRHGRARPTSRSKAATS